MAVVLVATGIWVLAGLWPSYMHLGSALRIAANFAGTGVAIILTGQLLVPILKLVAGLGLFTLRRWSWPVALVALVLDVITLGVTILRFHGVGGVVSPVPPEGALGGTVIQESSSILPVYAIWLLSLVCIVLMSRKALRGSWAKQLEAG